MRSAARGGERGHLRRERNTEFMTYAAKVLAGAARRLVLVQAGLVVLVVFAFFAWKGAFGAVAALFGGGIAILGTLISAWRLLRATKAAGLSARQGMAELYIGAGLRFVLTLGLMALGMGLLKLDPVGIIAGFAAAQIGYLFNRVPTDI